MHKMKVLLIYNNVLTQLNFNEIPPTVSWLNCDENQIATVKNIETHTKLQYLRIENNALPALDVSHSYLQMLMASKNARLTQFIARDAVHLEYIDLTHCNLSFVDQRMLQGVSELRSLQVAHNRITRVDVGSFANLNKLNYLDLSYNQIEFMEPALFRNMNRKETTATEGSSRGQDSFTVYKLHHNLLSAVVKNTLMDYFIVERGFQRFVQSGSRRRFPLTRIENIGFYTKNYLRSASMCSSLSPCTKCQGDCETDRDCVGNLLCLQTESPEEVVPGCRTGGGGAALSQARRGGTSDYCYDVRDVEVTTRGVNPTVIHPTLVHDNGGKIYL